MPYAGKDYQYYKRRCLDRTRRHGNWRQTYVDCAGMCQARMPTGEVCGETLTLEFHAPFGEHNHADSNQPKLMLRVLLCFDCHKAYHHGEAKLNERQQPSQLQQDVAYEIALAGNVEAWREKYQLIDRYQPFDMPAIPVEYLPVEDGQSDLTYISDL